MFILLCMLYFIISHHGFAFSIMYFHKNTYLMTYYITSIKQHNSYFQGLQIKRKKETWLHNQLLGGELSVQMAFEQKKAVWRTFC